MLIDDSELKLREEVCAEFRVKVSDIFKRGKPSELRRKIEKRMDELRTVKPAISSFDEYKEMVSPPVKRGRGRPRKNPLPTPISEPSPKKVEPVIDPENPPIPDDAKFITYKEARESIPPRAPSKIPVEEPEEKTYDSYKYANPNPAPLHNIDMSKVKFNPKMDVPKFLRAK